jgi:hypothetical protein
MMKLNLQDDPVHLFQINGEQFLPGRSFVNSEVGLYQLTPSLFILRLVCTNGLISRVSISLHFRHISRKFIEDYDLVMARFNWRGGLIYQTVVTVRDRIEQSRSGSLLFSSTDSTRVQGDRQRKGGDGMGLAFREMGETMFNVVKYLHKGGSVHLPSLAKSRFGSRRSEGISSGCSAKVVLTDAKRRKVP